MEKKKNVVQLEVPSRFITVDWGRVFMDIAEDENVPGSATIISTFLVNSQANHYAPRTPERFFEDYGMWNSDEPYSVEDFKRDLDDLDAAGYSFVTAAVKGR